MAVRLADEARIRSQLELCLPSYLTNMTGSEVRDVKVTSLDLPSGGQSNETVLIDITWMEKELGKSDSLVLRMQPNANQVFLNPDVIAEGELLQDLRRATRLPVPIVFVLEVDAAVLGRPFFLMSKIDGHVPGGRPSIHRDRWLMSLQPSERRRVITAGVIALAEVHETDWRQFGRFEGATYNSHTEFEQLRQWFDWAARGRSYPTIEAGIARLEVDVLHGSEDVLLWGDPRPGNIIYGEDLKVAALIDWEMASIGPADSDLGWWIMMDDFARRGAQGMLLEGMPTGEETIREYSRASGRTPSDLEHFKLLAAIRLAITLIPIGDSLVARDIIASDSEFARENVPNQMIAQQLGATQPQLCTDYRKLSRMGRPENTI
jgi:aminoglycoside phosphotransferase (APT) family kinase protein